MEVFISEEDKIENGFRFSGLEYRCSELDIQINSLEQHDAEIRKQERKQVIAELREWAKQTKVNVGIDIIDYECFKQKLNEMKGESNE